jgi:hypothetical protein
MISFGGLPGACATASTRKLVGSSGPNLSATRKVERTGGALPPNCSVHNVTVGGHSPLASLYTDIQPGLYHVFPGLYHVFQ